MPKIATNNTNTTPMEAVVEKPTKETISTDTVIASAVAAQVKQAMETMTPKSSHVSITTEQVTNMVADASKELKTKKERKERAPKTIPEDGNRCVARVWSGCGGQCTSVRLGSGEFPDLCKGCAAKASVCNMPNSFDKNTVEEGDAKPKRIGLRFGTIHTPLTELIFAPNGDIASVWPDPEVKSLVDQALKEGKKYHPGSKEGWDNIKRGGDHPPRQHRTKKAKKEKAPKKPRGKNAYMFYLQENRANIKKDLPDSAKVTEVTKEAGSRWKALSDEDRAVYQKMADEAAATAAAEAQQSISSLDTGVTIDSLDTEAETSVANDAEPVTSQDAPASPTNNQNSDPVAVTGNVQTAQEKVEKLIPEGGVGAMKVADLRQALEKLGIETKANGKNLSKKELVTALEAALKPSSDNSTVEGEEEEAEAEEITLADGTTVYYVEETGLCYSTDGEMEELGSYNSETNQVEP